MRVIAVVSVFVHYQFTDCLKGFYNKLNMLADFTPISIGFQLISLKSYGSRDTASFVHFSMLSQPCFDPGTVNGICRTLTSVFYPLLSMRISVLINQESRDV